ncbi:MAG: baeRF10 domain-containing protein [Thermoleophilia bacterium]
MVSKSVIDALRDFSSSELGPVVSLYLDIDGSRFPARSDYETELSIMISNTRKTAGERLELTRDQEYRLDAELKAISDFITLEFERNSVRSLLIFSCRAEGLWQTVPLNVGVRNELFVDFKPHIAPLVELLDRHQETCVLLTSKETARIFSVNHEGIIEHPEIMDEVSGHHGQGGWQQDKLQRRHQQEVNEHFKNAAGAALAYFKKERFHHFVAGVADELWPDLEKALHPYLRERLAGRFTCDINTAAKDIFARTNSMLAEAREAEDRDLLDSLGPKLTDGRIFVGGLDDVLAVLNQRRVDLLLIESGYRETGRYCYSCDTLVYSEESCPSCLGAMDHIDVVEEARELAVRQGSRIITVPPGHESLAQAGQIAARLRY